MIGRVLKIVFAIPFLVLSYGSITNWATMASYTEASFKATGLYDIISPLGLDMSLVVNVCLGIAVFLKLGGAAAIVTGGDLCGGIMIALFLAIVTPMMHNPVKDGVVDQGQFIQAMKNIGLLGAALYIAYVDYARKYTTTPKSKTH